MAYSKDLRIRAIEYFHKHNSNYRDVSSLFQIGLGTLHRWIKRFNQTGGIERFKPTGRPPLIDSKRHSELKEFVLKNSDSSLSVLSQKWSNEHGQTLSISALSRTISRTGLTLKKTFRAAERESDAYQEKRQIFLSQLESIPEENRVYIDEAGSNLAMTPSKAWSMRNHRAYDTKPARRGGNLSLVGALKKSGMPALYPYDGAVDSERFIDFIERCLQPNLNHDDVLIMDNCRIHHSKVVKRCMEELSIKVLYLPPYTALSKKVRN
jgi:transposase